MAEPRDDLGHRWEAGVEATWETVKVAADGTLKLDEILEAQRRRKKREKSLGSVRKGLMRELYIILDCSSKMSDLDLRPTRFDCAVRCVQTFISEFHEGNPISHLGIIAMRNGRAEKLCERTGDKKRLEDSLLTFANREAPLDGEVSLQNALALTLSSLKQLPTHATREVVIIIGSLTTCDPGNIFDTVEHLAQANIRVSIIGLAAQVHVCQVICEKTKGSYVIALDEDHLAELLLGFARPPPVQAQMDVALMRMGFPKRVVNGPPTKCMCHTAPTDALPVLKTSGFVCPQCSNKACELPMECRTCGLLMVSSPHLARSLQHLYLPPTFPEAVGATGLCVCCNAVLEAPVYQCPNCKKFICHVCDVFIHDTLQSCPGCAG